MAKRNLKAAVVRQNSHRTQGPRGNAFLGVKKKKSRHYVRTKSRKAGIKKRAVGPKRCKVEGKKGQQFIKKKRGRKKATRAKGCSLTFREVTEVVKGSMIT